MTEMVDTAGPLLNAPMEPMAPEHAERWQGVWRERPGPESKEGGGRCVWLGSCVLGTLAGSRPQEAGWGLVLSKKTGFCWSPSNPHRQYGRQGHLGKILNGHTHGCKT